MLRELTFRYLSVADIAEGMARLQVLLGRPLLIVPHVAVRLADGSLLAERLQHVEKTVKAARSTVLQLIGHEVRLSRLGRLLQAFAVLVLATSLVPIAWDAATVAIAMWAVAGGVALFAGLLVLQATLAFWTVESLEIMNVLTLRRVPGGAVSAQYLRGMVPEGAHLRRAARRLRIPRPRTPRLARWHGALQFHGQLSQVAALVGGPRAPAPGAHNPVHGAPACCLGVLAAYRAREQSAVAYQYRELS